MQCFPAKLLFFQVESAWNFVIQQMGIQFYSHIQKNYLYIIVDDGQGFSVEFFLFFFMLLREMSQMWSYSLH